jgi:hypothetical protein
MYYRPPEPPSNWTEPLEGAIPDDRTCYQVSMSIENSEVISRIEDDDI